MGKVDSIQVPIFEADSPDYESDFYAWLMEQSARLRLLRVPGIDSENLAEEIESLARRDRNEVASRLEILVSHLLKGQIQPACRGTSWKLPIREQRKQLATMLNDSPSLRRKFPDTLLLGYAGAIEAAALETSLAESSFPPECPWTPDQILSPGFLPDA